MTFFVGARKIWGKSELGYILRAEFDGVDQTYTHLQLLNKRTQGIYVGTLQNFENTAGTTVQTGGVWRANTPNPAAWETVGIVGQEGITPGLGWVALWHAKTAATDQFYLSAGWSDEATGTEADRLYDVTNLTDGTLQWGVSDADAAGLSEAWVVGSYLANTEHRFAIVLGGFDSSAVPYYAGANKPNYNYGAFFFFRSSDTWKLMAVTRLYGISSIYPRIMSTDNDSDNIDIERFVVPILDVSRVQEPVHFTSFDGSNGTGLDTITPEAGNGWTEDVGDWQISSNKILSNSKTDGDTASVDTGDADVIIKASIAQFQSGGNEATMAINVRYTDADNRWVIFAQASTNTFYLYEINGGTATLRASTSVTINSGTTYDITVRAEGTTISAWVNGNNKITYGSATLNQTTTTHGLRLSVSSSPSGNATCDNFVVWPVTSGNYSAWLDIF